MFNTDAYVSVHSQSNMPMFCPKKIISQHRVVEKSPFLAWRTLTHNILMSVIFRSHLTPPICLKMPICAIFSTFWESHLKHTPKVGVHREKKSLKMLLKNLWGLPNMLGVCHFIVIRVAKNWNFLRQKYKNLNIFYKTYLKV